MRSKNESDRVVALAGNPNVGKSTVFNALTGLNQHTGNWPGKTVTNARGYCQYKGQRYILIDLPGCYSLAAHSAEEEIARDFICFQKPDTVIVVCAADCLERNLNLVLQTIEITPNVVVCVNLMDEAKKKNIEIDFSLLVKRLGVPVIGTAARSKKGLDELMEAVNESFHGPALPYQITYSPFIENTVSKLMPLAADIAGNRVGVRWLALRFLENDKSFLLAVEQQLQMSSQINEHLAEKLTDIKNEWSENGITERQMKDDIAQELVKGAETISREAVTFKNKTYDRKDRALDKLLTSKGTGFPMMFLLLMVVFWITITGANYPSQLLSSGLFWIEARLIEFFHWLNVPEMIISMLIMGMYRVLAWVVSVMLPPMALFFPLFTLLEDVGYLPRVAFNLDKVYKKCCACGKQALTMCMGFGCNAAGVTGCRIIDSPRERLIAIITNNFVPCNGRFPTIIAVLSMFFIGTAVSFRNSVLSALLLTSVIIFGIMMTFLVSKLLSLTILKGVPSSFTLELPPYRKPQIGQVIVRSIFDRTLFVLGRAAVIAAPAGLLIWLLANITIKDMTLLSHCSAFLDPFAKLFGMDGVILLAFILALPANEIVIPIIIMTYMAKGNLVEIDNLFVLKNMLVNNGWTWVTAINVILFSLMHWPCATTCLTIKKETGSCKWTMISFLIPVIMGFLVCFAFSNCAKLVELILR
ncbi:ferrous iron transport protein B [Bacteroidia bacterium]|nr:ferrous iron transport protein B [Bacteroidia bacterium]